MKKNKSSKKLKIKYCPFCGNKDLRVFYNEDLTHCFVNCMDCSSEGPYATAEEEAIKLWNKAKRNKSTNSKTIGNIYENEIARKLSKWFTGSDKELVIYKTPGSGSVSTIRKKKDLSGNRCDGDFMCLDSKYEEFFNRFFLDSKSLTNINLFMTNPKNMKSNLLLNEWKKVVDDSDDKIPMMLVKIRDDMKIPEFIMFPYNIFIHSNHYISTIQYNFEDNIYNARIITQDEFFENCDWFNFLAACLFNKNF